MIGKYPKIQTLWKRDEKNKFVIMPGQYTKPEFQTVKIWDITEKIHGTNCRIRYADGKVTFQAKTDKGDLPAKLVNYLNEKFTPELMKEHFEDAKEVCLFTEGFGGYIQDVGKKYGKECKVCLFDVWVDNWWLKQEDVAEIAKKLEIDIAPHVSGHTTIENIVKIVKRGFQSSIAEETLDAEGIVARSNPLMLFRDGKPLMFKLKTKDYEKLKSVEDGKKEKEKKKA